MTKAEKEEQERQQGSALIYILVLPFVLIGLLLSYFARLAVIHGCKYDTAKFLAWPFSFVITQLFGCVFFLFGGFIMLFINRDAGTWAWANIADLALLPFFMRLYGVHKAFTTPIIDILIYQFVLWLALGRIVTREWTIAIYDSALQAIAGSLGVHPRAVRLERLRVDKGYAKAAMVYEKRGKWPLVSMLAILAVGTNPVDYY